MRKPFSSKISAYTDAVGDVRETVRNVGDVAYSQASLNIALTAVAITALFVAALLIHSGAGHAR